MERLASVLKWQVTIKFMKSTEVVLEGRIFYVSGVFDKGQKEEGYEPIPPSFSVNHVTLSDSSFEILEFLNEDTITKLEELAVEQLIN